MMRVNQFNSNSFTQNTQNRNTRTSNTPSFAGVMSNVSGQQQTTQFMPQQSNTMQMLGMQAPGMGMMSGISGMQSNFPTMMPGGNMPSGMPTGQMPEMPSGEMPAGEPPALPDGEELPELPDGQTPPEMPSGQTPPEIPSGEMPASAPGESDSSMQQPPFGQPGFGSMNSFRAMSFMNR
ncbi:MAG: hypothetical protein IJP54_07760 [Synergistaceae bacterium]|nr:hypothetical protein [Synergistaceae bacterium]MBR0035559.1 hypothetical protein [Synergistaceae bacterium]